MLVSIHRENYLEGDPTCAYKAALALRTIQHFYGIIPRVFGKGVAAKQVIAFIIYCHAYSHHWLF